eukprot:TRINITY_DN1080_c0_g1_i1.p2 TRINITY_DN1080_c0_g1~~TRINITY_DN1080_c0_g1_i1.p2  ORF type:complete len:352 (+),score=22.30 TRINITY_DN1080_c0_g1_i1:311-1366(+)
MNAHAKLCTRFYCTILLLSSLKNLQASLNKLYKVCLFPNIINIFQSMDFHVNAGEPLEPCKGVLDGKYKVYCTIGDGQFAKQSYLLKQQRVRLAQAVDTMEWHAVKIMKEHQVNSAEKLAYFMNEVRLLSQCSHKHVVQIISASISGALVKPTGKKKPAVYYVMCHAKYGEIYRLVRETGRFTEVQARSFFRQLLGGKTGSQSRVGLDFLHSKGIAHRDIKPENLLLNSSLNLVIADFGSAARYRNEENKTMEFDSAVIVGSQEYNAPEINMDKSYKGDKADLFSCAVCLFVMVIGSIPFRIASSFDPYFKLLSKKDKSSYWEIYSAVPISAEFKGTCFSQHNLIKTCLKR